MEKHVKVVKLSESVPEVAPKLRGHTKLFSEDVATECEVIYQRGMPGHIGAYHVHKHAENVWIVMQGEMEAIVGGVRYFVKAGEAIFMPPGIPHATGTRGEVEFLAIEIYAPSIRRFNPIDSSPVQLPSKIEDAV